MKIEFKKISPEKISEVLELLKIANLPTLDIGENVELFSLETNEKTIATAGLEVINNIGLLRSVSVLESQKGNGYGYLVVQNLESYAKTLTSMNFICSQQLPASFLRKSVIMK